MGLFDKFKKKETPSKPEEKGVEELKFKLIDCDYAPQDMENQLPITFSIIRQLPGSDTNDYWLAKCEKPIKYGDKNINYIVVGCRYVGSKLGKGVGNIALNVAYVIDESLLDDTNMNFEKCEYVAICIAEELGSDAAKVKTHNLGGCIITKSLYEGTSKLKWIFREEGVNPVDNGWRAIGDTDTEEYINTPGNNVVVDFDRLVEIEPAVLSIYNMPVGTDLEFFHDETGRYFIDTHTGKRIS